MDNMNYEFTLYPRFMNPQNYAMQLWTNVTGLVESILEKYIFQQHKHLFLVKYLPYHPLI